MVVTTVIATEAHTADGIGGSDASQNGETGGDVGETLPPFGRYELGGLEVGAGHLQAGGRFGGSST
jgi:hypothetical protein